MLMSDSPRMLFVHAHPDDESLTTGATIAHYAALGATVEVITCTLGEEGEVIGSLWSQLSVDHADQLGGYRISELRAALAELGVPGPNYLGGAGRWRDSGMAGTTPRRAAVARFVDADADEVRAALVMAIRSLRPHVVVTYDPGGGYGHPDHMHAYAVTADAIGAAAAPQGFPGEAWSVPKFYWTVFSTTAMVRALDALEPGDLRPEWTLPTGPDFTFGYPDDRITTVVEASDSARDAKCRALAAHATQVVVGPTGKACALSNNVALPIVGQEHFVLATGAPGDRDVRGWETDLLAGLGF